ncbi:MAG: GAF domain-containing protein [Moorea sp. SIO2B7]|nr:GAF domain-containing protein [Moorena sp. SIO2B7]
MKATSHQPSSSEDDYTTIDIVPEGEEQKTVKLSESVSSSSIVTTTGKFSAYLAPLNQDSFKEVVTGVEEKLQVFHDTLSMLDSVLDTQGFDAILNDMLQSITLKTGELLGADRTTIFLLDQDKDELWSIVAKGEDGKPLEIRMPADKGIAGEVATSRQVVNIPYDFYDDPRSTSAKEFEQKTGYRTYTMLAMPLLKEEPNEKGERELVAVVQLLNKLKSPHDPAKPLEERISHQGFTDEDVNMFREFEASIRLILESSRSFYRATQRQRAANALIGAINSLSKGNLDLDATLKTVMDEAKKLMNAARSTLWLIDHDKNDLWAKITKSDGSLKELRVPIGEGFAGKVAQMNLSPDRSLEGETLNISFDLYNHPDSGNSQKTDQEIGFRTCSLLCMPVFNSDEELIGVTQLVNKEKKGDFPEYNPENWPKPPERWKASFNRSDQEFMKAFNIQAGVAIQNAKLFNQVKQQEQMQHDMLRSLTNGVISTDKKGIIIAANEKAKELLGFGKDDPLEGKQMSELVEIREQDITDKSDVAKKGKFSEWFARALSPKEDEDRQQYYPDQPLMSAAGEEHSVNLSINSITDTTHANNVYGALVVMDDISDEKRLKNTMYRYMTQELAEQLLKSGSLELGGDRKEVSVLFSDIRSYTSLTEKLQPEEVVSMLNEYFDSMVEAIFTHKGTLDKYIGDAIMAVFGSPLTSEDHAWEAVQTALEMSTRLKEFNKKRQAENKEIIEIGIGINSDFVISGNIGSSRRMEFTAIGDGVNLSSRLEGTSKQYGCEIVISENTYNTCKDEIIVRELDRIRVKGKTQPVSIYELVGYKTDSIPEQTQQVIELYHQGRDYYLQHQFARALGKFAEVLEIDCHNKSAKLHMQRCQHFFTHPPADDWDGIWVLTSK